MGTTAQTRTIMIVSALLAAIVALSPGWAAEDEVEQALDINQPLLSVYGPRAPTREGDHDHLQIIYVSVPASRSGEVFLRVFDPDTVGKYDTAFGSPNDTRTRFSVFGGDGVLLPVTVSGAPENTDLATGKLLHKGDFASRRRDDAKWHTLVRLDPSQGQDVDGARVFRVTVQPTRGNDGNVFSLALSSAADHNRDVDGARIYSRLPTIRVPDNRSLTELRFRVPADATLLHVSNFDASFGSVVFTSTFRSLTLGESGQDIWRTTPVDVLAEERGKMAALTFRGGEEIPNDLSVYARSQSGEAIEFGLPPRIWLPHARPEIALSMIPRGCDAVSLSAAGSTDVDGDDLNYLWRFGADKTAHGVLVTRTFPGPGTYPARLELTDTSGQVGNGVARDFQVIVKAPPVAVAKSAAVVAAGEPVLFDGRESSSGEYAIASHVWTLNDGSTLQGSAVTAVFDTPGIYTAKLHVVDASGHPCDTDDTTTQVRVNARPAARAGEDRHVAAGQNLVFDAAASSDYDGKIVQFAWELGDGAVKVGRRIEHAFTTPGAYTVSLRVSDDSGAANAVGLDTVRIVVNARPVARAGDDVTAQLGEQITFDASASSDADGDTLIYEWDFGNGAKGAGATPSFGYQKVGTYRVTLSVRDGTGLSNNRHSEDLTVTIVPKPNQVPVARAGADITAVIGEVIRFDAAASMDPDGNISSYKWDFGDGGHTQGVSAIHTYWKAGEYTAKLTVADDYLPASASASDSLTVHVRVPDNAAPVARAGKDLVVKVGEVIAFDATASRDPDGNIIAFNWSFGDGGKAKGIKPIHAYHHPGEYRVELVVRDDGPVAESAADTLIVQVRDR